MSQDAFVKAIRANPDDDTARLVFADWYEEQGEPERAEYIRASCRLARMPFADPEYPAVQRRCLDLYAAHHAAWVGEWPSDVEWSFDRGLVTGAFGTPAALATHWEDLFARHPIHRVRTSDSVPVSRNSGRQEIGWLPLVDDLRVYWRDPDHTLFGAFEPDELRFRRLWIDGDPDPGQILKMLRGATREVIESFRYVYCRYTHSEQPRWDIQVDAFNRALDVLDNSPLRELGLLPGGHSFDASYLQNVIRHNFSPQLEYLELSAAEPTKDAADLLAATDRLPQLKKLAHGIDRENRLHSLEAILNSPRLSNLSMLTTEWSNVSDRHVTDSAFAQRATEVQLWRPISASLPRSRTPLAREEIKPEVLDVAVGEHRNDYSHRWLSTPWASEVRELRLRTDAEDVLAFATRLARSEGFPGLRRFTLILDGTPDATHLSDFVTAARETNWLRNVLITCHCINVPGPAVTAITGLVPAATPDTPGDLAWYACPPNVGRLRTFHVLPEK